MAPSTLQTHSPPPPPTFCPPEEVISQILTALPNPDTTLRDLAERFSTSLDALTLFLARPDIAARLAAMADAFAARARLVATAHLPTVAHMLTRMLDDHLDETAHIPVNPKSLPAIEQRRRSRETARRAATLLLRIAKFQAGPSTVRAPRHAEDEATPQSPPSFSTSTPNPRVSPSSPASLPTSPSGPLSLVGERERSGEGSHLDLPSPSTPSALESPSPSSTSSPPKLPTPLPSTQARNNQSTPLHLLTRSGTLPNPSTPPNTG